jgi:hypothetical protein
VVQKLIDLKAVLGSQGDADAQVASGLMALQIVSVTGNDFPQLLRERFRLFWMLQTCPHDRKFIATQAGNQISFIQTTANSLRHFLQKRVSGLMAERIVDALEVIEIEAEHGKLCATPHK